MKKFIITVDTEGDNLWAWKPGDKITTENARYIDRFQCMCEEYQFFPVYLCNYEMICDDAFCKYITEKASLGKCEIGMHLHAWNTPPEYDIENIYGGQTYITEFTREQMLEKHSYLKSLIENRTGFAPVSYRSGRWATNETLFSVLEEIGVKVDCSITPGINMSHISGMSVSGGNSYVGANTRPYKLSKSLIEVPMTTRKIKCIDGVSLKNRCKNIIIGRDYWLRPAMCSFEQMRFLTDRVKREKILYLEFMIHSSELMPGGSPYSRDRESADRILSRTEQFFRHVSEEYEGIMLKDYYYELINSM